MASIGRIDGFANDQFGAEIDELRRQLTDMPKKVDKLGGNDKQTRAALKGERYSSQQKVVLRRRHAKGDDRPLDIGPDGSEWIGCSKTLGILLRRATDHEQCCSVSARAAQNQLASTVQPSKPGDMRLHEGTGH